MRFNCGASKETKFRMQREAAETSAQELRQWHKVFLWFPVRIEDGHCHWLETVERRFLYAGYSNVGHSIGGKDCAVARGKAEYRVIDKE